MATPQDDYRPRISVEITPDTQKRMQSIPWGLLSPVIRALLDDVLDLVEAGGDVALAMLINKRIRARDLLKMKLEEKT